MTALMSVKVSRLKSILIDDSKPRPVFLLGAGASVKSGIPLVRDLVQQIARVGYCHDQGWDFRDPRPQQSDWLQWLKAQTWYDDAAPLEVTYPQLGNVNLDWPQCDALIWPHPFGGQNQPEDLALCRP